MANAESPHDAALSRAHALPVFASKATSRRQLIGAVLFCLVICVVGVLCTPIADLPLTPVPGFMTAFGAGMLVINALLAALLLSKGAIEQRPDIIRLGTAYLFVAAIFVPLTLSFKDGFVPGVIFGSPASSVWLWSAWHAGFGLLISGYALRANSNAPARSLSDILLIVLAAVAVLSVMATAGVGWLPTLLWNGKTFFTGAMSWIPAALVAINVVALVLCLRLRARTTEQLWVTVAMVAACFDLWLTAHGGSRFALGWYLSKCGSLVTSFVVLALLFNDITELYRNSARANRVLTELVNLDGLTGVRNRRFFDERLELEWRKATADQTPISILMIDVDHFKPFNDRYGHALGDDALRSAAACLAENTREPDAFVCRYGGEEFAVILPRADLAQACGVAEALRASVEALEIPHEHNRCGVLTVSVGVATRIPDAESLVPSLLRKADLALYAAKRGGRNSVARSDGSSAYAGEAPPRERKVANG